MSGVLKPGDVMATHGTFAIHVYSPNVAASLENSHFPHVADSWFSIVECEDVIGNSGAVLELAGSVRLVGGDSSTMASLVCVSIGGLR